MSEWHMLAEFYIEMEWVPWKRACLNSKRHFTDPRHLKAKMLVQSYMQRAKVQFGIKDLINDPFKCDLIFYKRRPKRISAEYLKEYPARVPDEDNLGKLIKDAGNEILWTDDARIVSSLVEKRYGEPEGVQVRLWRAAG